MVSYILIFRISETRQDGKIFQ